MATQRIYAIDVLRGLTVAAMIIVNNAGGKLSYACLQHSEWNGMTLCDMVFPSFLFIVGLTTYISLCKTSFRYSAPLMWKILRRAIVILLIGWGIHIIESLCKGHGLPIANLRLTGVLPRIALCYFFVSAAALVFKRNTLIFAIAGLLAAYAAVLLLGNGYANDCANVLAVIDHSLLGDGHLYAKRPIDPEGIVSTLGAIAHTLIGFCFGSIFTDKEKSLSDKQLQTMVYGFALLLLGLAASLALPINKRVWSPSFVLVSCGLAALTLGLISYATDLKGVKKPFKVFDVFGVNPLFLYVLSELTAIALSATKAKPAIYEAIASTIPDPYAASAIYSLLFVCAMWLAGYPLYKSKIYIKI